MGVAVDEPRGYPTTFRVVELSSLAARQFSLGPQPDDPTLCDGQGTGFDRAIGSGALLHGGETGIRDQQIPRRHVALVSSFIGRLCFRARPCIARDSLMSALFPTLTRLYAPSAMLAEGWANDVLIEIDEAGWIQRIEAGVSPGDAERAAGPLLPGMPNLHGHAFQRAMAGLAEHASAPEDSFWTWREVMYRFVDRLGPEEAQAIASQLYVEMLEAGYTAAAEFHYLHHAPNGRPYADPAEMGRRVVATASETGMGLTLLPVLYAQGGFGNQPPGDAQRRFINDIDNFQKIVEVLYEDGARDPNRATGIAPHSLRAVTEGQLREAVESLNRLDTGAPIHIHVAEQLQEVRDCLLWSGQRPVRWLLDRFEVDRRWCLVHATHIDAGECRDLAASGAVAGLCPTTEA